MNKPPISRSASYPVVPATGRLGSSGFVDREDLLDDDPGLRPGDLAQPRQIAGRIGQSVRVVDAHAVDQTFVEPALDLDVGGVEHGAVLLAQAGQRGDREEPPVTAHPVAPADQAVVLAVVHLGGRCPNRYPAQWDSRGRRAAVRPRRPRGSATSSSEPNTGNTIRPSSNVPVDVEVRRVRRVSAVLQDVPPPLVLLG